MQNIENVSKLKDKIQNWHSQNKKQEKILKEIKKRIQHLEKKNYQDVKEIEKLKENISKYSQNFNDYSKELENLKLSLQDIENILKNYIENYENKFYSDLKKLLAPHHILIEEIRLPDIELYYTINEKKILLYILEVENSQNLNLWYGRKIEKLFKEKKNLNNFYKKFKSFQEDLTNKRFSDSDHFLENIFLAYKNILIKKHQKWDESYIGEEVYFYEILLELNYLLQDKKFYYSPSKKNFKEYTRIHFSFDLALLEKNQFQNYKIQMQTATRSDTAKFQTNLWIPKNNLGVHISKISFKKL